MTDLRKAAQQALEAAAKAAGYVIELHPNHRIFPSLPFLLDGRPWNPLTDDGDALRLAVKLELFHRFYIDEPLATIHFDATDPDPYAATRRAIVRAAAEIGKEMK